MTATVTRDRQMTLYSALNSALFTLCSVQCIQYIVHCTVYSVTHHHPEAVTGAGALTRALHHTWPLLHCAALYRTVLHCTALYCTSLHLSALHCTVR